MRLLIVGSDKVFAIENFYVRYLKESAIEMRLFTAQSIFYDYYQSSILHKILFKAGISPIIHKINSQFKQVVTEFEPQVIFIFKGMEIFPESLQWARQRGIKLVNYNPDNPFLFTGKGSGNMNVTNSIQLYDLHLTYDGDIKKELEQKYKIPTGILPFGFDLNDNLYNECAKQREVKKVCFLGNPDAQRAAFIDQLAEHLPIDVYGNNWSKFVQGNNITVYEPVYGNEFWKTLYRYRVQLNLMRIHNPNSHNMRSFEVPGVGGIGLYPYTVDHALYFETGKEIFLYKDLAECINLSRTLLNMSDEEAFNVRSAARLKSLQAGYSYCNRALLALQEIKKLML
jgi:spore maturation protein CgeB